MRPLVGYNFGWDKPLPWFKLFYEREEDLETLSTVYKNLHEMGQPLSQEHIADRFKVPLPQKGETPLAPSSAPGNGNTPLAARYRPKTGDQGNARVIIASDGNNAPDAPEMDIADLIAESLGRETLPIGDAIIAPLGRLLADVTSLAELRDRIIEIYGQMDSAELGAAMAQAMTIADLAARLEVKSGH